MDPRIAELIDGLASRRDALQAAVAAVPPSLRGERPAAERWSVAEVLEHLVLVERSITKLVSRMVPTAPARPVGEPFDAAAFGAEVALPQVLDRTRRVESGAGARPAGAMDDAAAWAALAGTRASLLEQIRAADGRALEGLSYSHPLLGPLNPYQWIAFVGLHEARHAEQIREVGAVDESDVPRSHS